MPKHNFDKFHKMELKSPSIPLFPPGQNPKGETLMSLPFVMGGAAVQSQTMAPDAGEGFKKIILNS